MRNLSTILATFLFSFCALAEFDHTHESFDNVLKQYVSYREKTSDVNYKSLKSNSKQLNSYLKQLETLSKEEFNEFNNKQKLAFWINAYNAYTLKLVIDNFPVDSIKEIKRIFSAAFSPWDIEFINLLGRELDLNDIEHNIIRKEFKEPRIHFALVCASRGCPPLLNIAWNENNLEELFKESSKKFLSDSNKNKIDIQNKKLSLSKIFDWYGDDFKNKGGFLKYIAPFITTNESAIRDIQQGKYSVEFLDYDWGLNKKL